MANTSRWVVVAWWPGEGGQESAWVVCDDEGETILFLDEESGRQWAVKELSPCWKVVELAD